MNYTRMKIVGLWILSFIVIIISTHTLYPHREKKLFINWKDFFVFWLRFQLVGRSKKLLFSCFFIESTNHHHHTGKKKMYMKWVWTVVWMNVDDEKSTNKEYMKNQQQQQDPKRISIQLLMMIGTINISTHVFFFSGLVAVLVVCYFGGHISGYFLWKK